MDGGYAVTVVDAFTREALSVYINHVTKGKQVVEATPPNSLIRGAPKTVRVDNSPEFILKAHDCWVYEDGVTLNFSRLGIPTDNAFMEPFNGRLRDECLNAHWFLSVTDARNNIEVWQRDFNEGRPRTTLG